jgi:hypothetical protein
MGAAAAAAAAPSTAASSRAGRKGKLGKIPQANWDEQDRRDAMDLLQKNTSPTAFATNFPFDRTASDRCTEERKKERQREAGGTEKR